MLAAVKSAVSGEGETVLVATAAVADWRPAKCADRKLKKRQMSNVVKLVRNPDILKTVKGVRKVGFAAETGSPVEEAARKCREKKLEFVVANDVLEKGAGFGCDTNRVTFVTKDGIVEQLPLKSKLSIARRIVRFAERLPPA
jgi:phosphopantothenoylcysteine decarboxylase/phosphopantothenate--cysteine ligase